MVTYATAQNVMDFLQLTLTTLTSPTIAQVEEWIEQNEEVFDRDTMHSWRATPIVEELASYVAYDNMNLNFTYSLNHRKIKTLDNGEGDKLEVLQWNGDWVDYLVDKEEGRIKDYWIDYDGGKINFPRRGFYNFSSAPHNFLSKNVRVTYRYGEAVVPKSITKAIVLLTCIDIVSNYPGNVLYPEDGQTIMMNQQTRVGIWEKQAEKIMNDYREIKAL